MSNEFEKAKNRILNQKPVAFALIVLVILVGLITFGNKIADFRDNYFPATTQESINQDTLSSKILEKPDSVSKKEIAPALKRDADLGDLRISERIEVSIQLQKNHLGAREILVNGIEKYENNKSIPTNPRFYMDYKEGDLVLIRIITRSNDTCIVKRSSFDYSNVINRRIKPDCL